MGCSNYADLKRHIGHKIECVYYGDTDTPANVAVECETCGEVLFDYDFEPTQCAICNSSICFERNDPVKQPPEGEKCESCDRWVCPQCFDFAVDECTECKGG